MQNLFEIINPSSTIRYIVYRGWLPDDMFEHIAEVKGYDEAIEFGYPEEQTWYVDSKTDAISLSQKF